jgi:hypothetical protein
MTYLLTAIGLSPDGSSIVNIYTQTIHRTTRITINLEECGPCPFFASFTLAFALQMRKKHGKTSVIVRKTSVRIQYTYYQNTHTLQNLHTHTLQTRPPPTHIHTHITKQYKTTKVQIKTNTVQDIPKWNSHNIIKDPQYKFTLMYIAPLSTRTLLLFLQWITVLQTNYFLRSAYLIFLFIWLYFSRFLCVLHFYFLWCLFLCLQASTDSSQLISFHDSLYHDYSFCLLVSSEQILQWMPARLA